MALNAPALKKSFQAVAPRADYLADRFYSQLFLDYPEQIIRFGGTDFADQQQKLVGALSAIIRQLDDETGLVEFVTRLGERHAAYDLSEHDYSAVTETLIAVLAEVLGSDFWNSEYEDAWREALATISQLMQQGARTQMAKQAATVAVAVSETTVEHNSIAPSTAENDTQFSDEANSPAPLPGTPAVTTESIPPGPAPAAGHHTGDRNTMISTAQTDGRMATDTQGDAGQDQEQFLELAAKVEAISKSQAVIEFELDGTIITANDNFLNTVGYSLNEIQGQHHRMFVENAYGNSNEYKMFWAKLNNGEFIADEFKRIGNGGQEIWIQASYNPIFDKNGKPYKVVKFATDITAQKLQNADYEGQIEAIGKAQAVIEFEMDGTIITANDNFLKTMGYTLDEVRGQHHRLFVDPTFAQGSEYQEFWAKLNRGEYSSDAFRRIGKGLRFCWIQAAYRTSTAILDLNGKPFKVVTICRGCATSKSKWHGCNRWSRIFRSMSHWPIAISNWCT